MVTTLTSKGQLTVPAEIREKLNLKPGDRLDFTLMEDGRIEVVPLRGSLKNLKGLLPPPRRKMTVRQMDEAIRRGASR